jgi:hypothetical protein
LDGAFLASASVGVPFSLSLQKMPDLEQRLQESCNNRYEQEHENRLQDTHRQGLVIVHPMCH